MGTNYYLETSPAPPCPCCQRPFKNAQHHIGTSAGGWCFALHVYPEDGIHNLSDWIVRWFQPDSIIRDEDGNEVSPADMLEKIANRSAPPRCPPKSAEWYSMNYALPGPNGLIRHVADGQSCIGHGPGTWDYMVGEFS